MTGTAAQDTVLHNPDCDVVVSFGDQLGLDTGVPNWCCDNSTSTAYFKCDYEASPPRIVEVVVNSKGLTGMLDAVSLSGRVHLLALHVLGSIPEQ